MPTILHDLDEALIRGYKNEVAIDTKSTFKDPIKLRGGSWWRDLWYVIISGDVLTGDEADPRRDERGFFGIRHNDDYPKSSNAPEFALYLTDPDKSGADEFQKIRLRVTTDYMELMGKRLYFDNTGRPPVTRFYGDGHRYCFNVQDDDGGKLVQYDTWKPGTRIPETDESKWVAVRVFRGEPVQ